MRDVGENVVWHLRALKGIQIDSSFLLWFYRSYNCLHLYTYVCVFFFSPFLFPKPPGRQPYFERSAVRGSLGHLFVCAAISFPFFPPFYFLFLYRSPISQFLLAILASITPHLSNIFLAKLHFIPFVFFSFLFPSFVLSLYLSLSLYLPLALPVDGEGVLQGERRQ